jgi:hypothetical protein
MDGEHSKLLIRTIKPKVEMDKKEVNRFIRDALEVAAYNVMKPTFIVLP